MIISDFSCKCGIVHIIFNFCITNSVFSSIWKKAYIIPLGKIKNPKNFKDLRPISILPIISKILEKTIDIQLRNFLEENCLLPKTQSGFRWGHSYTSALLKITDDLLTACDKKISDCYGTIGLFKSAWHCESQVVKVYFAFLWSLNWSYYFLKKI